VPLPEQALQPRLVVAGRPRKLLSKLLMGARTEVASTGDVRRNYRLQRSNSEVDDGCEVDDQGKEFINCNCAYGCPCQFNALPTHGFCEAVGGFQIDSGFHGETRLDGLKFVGIFSLAWTDS